MSKSSFSVGSLSTRILAWSIGAMGSALLLATLFSAIDQRNALERVFDRQRQALTESIGAFVIEQVISMDYPALDHAIKVAARQNDQILSIEVSHYGRIVSKVGEPAATGRVYKSEVMRRLDRETSIGDVRVVFSNRDLDALVARSIYSHLAMFFLVFFITGGSLRMFMRKSVIVPIESMILRTEEATARVLPETRDEVSAATATRDEIALLELRFNRLITGLMERDGARKAAERALLDYQDNLEKLIAVRTRQLQSATDEAERGNQAKTEFLAAASHDLRQPLQAMTLFAGTLMQTPLDPAQRELCTSIGFSIQSMREMLNGLLDLSRLDSGLVKPQLVPIDPMTQFERIDGNYSQLARQRGLRFKFFFPQAPLRIVSDPKLLGSILDNLIGNAIKYTEQGGVLVALRRRGQLARLQVWDTGIGIAPEHHGKIFTDYFQIDNPARDRNRGLGLGLAIVRRMSTLLDCPVRFRSVVGKGSVFEIDLPLADPAEADESVAAPTPSLPVVPADQQLEGHSILVVEDDEMLRRAIRASLISQGMQVHSHATAEDALADPECRKTDYCLTDLRLPGMNGIDMLQRLTQGRATPLKAILLTGDTHAEHVRTARAAGWIVLHKPVDLGRLLATLTQLS